MLETTHFLEAKHFLHVMTRIKFWLTYCVLYCLMKHYFEHKLIVLLTELRSKRCWLLLNIWDAYIRVLVIRKKTSHLVHYVSMDRITITPISNKFSEIRKNVCLTRWWVCLLWTGFALKCTYRIYSMLLNILPCVLYTSSLSVQAFQRTLIYFYNGSFVAWTIERLTAAKFKPLIFYTNSNT
jgi:hypothetical protein